MHNCVYHLKFTGYDKHGFAVMECQKCKKGFILISVEQNEQNEQNRRIRWKQER